MYTSTVAVFSLLAAAVAALPATSQSPCTTAVVHYHKIDMSRTTTVYDSIVTATAEVDCKGCLLEERWIAAGGHGPVIPGGRTATLVLPASTTTVFVCKATPAPSY